MDPRIADYIRANRRRYTREAITQQLVEAGHDPAEIERTWVALDTPDRDDVAGEGFWGRFALIVVGINVTVFILVALLTGMLQAIEFGGGMMALVFAIVLAIGALIAWGLVAATGPAKLRPGVALGIGIVIPALFALLIGGSCYALLGAAVPGFTPPQTGSGTLELREPFAFTGSGEVFCNTAPAAGATFSVFAENLDPSGDRHINLSLDAGVPVGDVPAEPAMGGPALFVAVAGDPEQPTELGYHAGPTSEVEIDASIDGASGSVRFEGLEASPMEGDGPSAPAPTETMSGTFTWTCE